MGLFGRSPDPKDVLIVQLRAELSDLRTLHFRERDQWLEERKNLLDHLMALSNPLALREMRRTSQGETPSTPANTPRRTYYPRSEHLVVPPYPPLQSGSLPTPTSATYPPAPPPTEEK
jgi:hypothetical protein